MSLKAKLVSTIAAFVMVLALMVVGVLAASSATVDLGGSISFTSDHVLATVAVSVTGSEQDATITGEDYTESFTSDMETASWTKNDINLSFVDQDTDIVISIRVDNDSDERALTITAATLPSVTGGNIRLVGQPQVAVNGETGKDLTTSPVNVPASQYAIITMTIEIIDTGASVTASSWTADFALANVAAKA